MDVQLPPTKNERSIPQDHITNVLINPMSETGGILTQVVSTVADMVSSERLIQYFVITYAFSWVFWIPMAFQSAGLLLPSLLSDFLASPFNPAPFGPLVAALVLSVKYGGAAGAKALLASGVNHRFPKVWLIPALLLMPAVILASAAIGVLSMDFAFPILVAEELVFVLPVAFVVVLLTAGPLQEEFGWRGYALPRLQARFGALVSSVILGLLWAGWHLPLFWVFAGVPNAMYYSHPVWVMFAAVTLNSIVFTWVYNNTDNSVLSTMLLHTSFNLFLWLIPITSSVWATYASVALLLLVAVVIVAVNGPTSFRRQH
ncbi:MAG: CPBP family intramembrane metalloprotease [Candidatus Thorarchaeota archaeon]|nr:CPBP family intramembrane metalloprotease [Candidatus Thorarchaeota archaeon]